MRATEGRLELFQARCLKPPLVALDLLKREPPWRDPCLDSQFQFHVRLMRHFSGIPENGRHPTPVIGYRAGIIQIFEPMVGQADDRGSELSGGQKPACRVD